jgi:hypothetical protein
MLMYRAFAVVAALVMSAATLQAQDPPPRVKPRPAEEADTIVRRVPRPRVDSTVRVDSTPTTTGGGVTVTPPGGQGGPPVVTTTTPVVTQPAQRGKYRITLNGFKVQRQTYDHLLMLDGKDDEVYFAAHVAVIDTASSDFSGHVLLRSDVYGDVSGFPDRVKAGRGFISGGIQRGDAVPNGAPWVRFGEPTPARLPMLLWEGELVQGQRAVVIAPSVWEWDGNAELFGRYALSLTTTLERWHTPKTLDAILHARHHLPIVHGTDGLQWSTNRIGDPRDRPIGMAAGRAVPVAGPGNTNTLAANPTAVATFVSASTGPVDREPSGEGGGGGGPVTGTSTTTHAATPFFPQAIGRLATAANANALGGRLASGPVNGLAGTVTMLSTVQKSLLGTVRFDLKLIASLLGPHGARNLPRTMAAVAAAARDLMSPTMYFFEQVLVITPESAEAALNYRVNRYMPYGIIEITYADPAGYDGNYVLYIQVERIP